MEENIFVPFVIVNDKIIYADGEFDYLDIYDPTTMSTDYSQIVYIDKALGFKDIEKKYNEAKKNKNTSYLYKNNNYDTRKATFTFEEIKEKLGVDELTIIYE